MRVGIALARGLAMGSGVPLVGFCSLEAHFPQEDGPFVAAFDARAGGVYFLKGERSGDEVLWEEPQVGPPEMLEGLKIVSPDGSLAAEESVPRLGHLRFTENIDALYMRKTQAERELET
jgi:tRNA A37 threonylcarbamoyladenosine modification protein TsaB